MKACGLVILTCDSKQALFVEVSFVENACRLKIFKWFLDFYVLKCLAVEGHNFSLVNMI